MDEIIIRAARGEGDPQGSDLEAIIHVYMGDSDVGHGDSWEARNLPAYERAFAQIMQSPDNLLFVATLDDAVIGTFQLTLIPGLVGRGRLRGKIESVHVLPGYRNHGIGARMIAHAIDLARARGAGIVELTSNKQRLAAHRFYERLGFARSHEGFKLVL
jgi:GNAT superfamily N-acetyltransferase